MSRRAARLSTRLRLVRRVIAAGLDDQSGFFAQRHPHLPLVDREEHLLERCTGRSVLHLGCIDDPFLETKVRAGQWLHHRLREVARSIVGVDSSATGVEHARALGYPEIVLGDAEQLGSLGLAERFEVVVAGEIVEHLLNPGLCLAGIQPLLAANGALLVTVPNAFFFQNFLDAADRVEMVHPDHTAWYSHSTITSLLGKAGYEVRTTSGYVNRHDPVVLQATRLSPLFCNGFVVEATVAATSI